MPHDPLPKHVSKERAQQFDDEWRAILSGAPAGHIPYHVWSRQVDDLCRERSIALASPQDLAARLAQPRPPQALPLVETLLQYQEAFYRDRYQDPSFAFDRSRLYLPKARVDDILDAITRKEVNYPLVVAIPLVLAEDVGATLRGRPNDGRGRSPAPTLHRFLLDRLIRSRNVEVWQRSDPDTNTFLEQVRDLTLADLTLDAEGWKARGQTGIGPDGQSLRFEAVDGVPDAEQPWLRYLQALYPTLPRPTVTPGYLDLSFTAWERDPPASRIIPNAQEPGGGAATIQEKSQLDAVTFRYPLITPSRYLALFAQYHAATRLSAGEAGEHLDAATWSWTFGIIDPAKASDGPSVHVYWSADELPLGRNRPGSANSRGRLRSSR